MTPHPDHDPYRVGILPVPGFALMSYACTVEALRAANLIAGRTLYEMVHFADGAQAHSSGAASVRPDHPIGAMPVLDLLLVVAGGDPMRFDDAATLAWLRRIAARGTVMGGVSGGPVILARAGLMEGRRMTVHWDHATALAEADPSLLIERKLYVIDRDRITCAGGSAPLDLMHALIAEHHGAAFAREVSDWFLHTAVRLSGAPQRGSLAERLGTHAAPVLDAVAAMEDHIADPLSLSDLARLAGTSPRHLNRLFRASLGSSVMAHYRALRLAVAHKLITTTGMALVDIALATGFSGSSKLSRMFAKTYGHTPRALRGHATHGTLPD